MTQPIPAHAEVWLKDRIRDLAAQRRAKPFRPVPPAGFQVGDEVEITSEPGFSPTSRDGLDPWDYQWGRIGDRGRVRRLRSDGGIIVEGIGTCGCEINIGMHCLSLARPAVRAPAAAQSAPAGGFAIGDEVEIISEPGHSPVGPHAYTEWVPEWGVIGHVGRVTQVYANQGEVGVDGIGTRGYPTTIGTHCLGLLRPRHTPSAPPFRDRDGD